MKQFEHQIDTSSGLHARLAGELVQQVRLYNSEVIIKKGNLSADGKRLFSVLSLCALQGDELQVLVQGVDEEKACKSLQEWMKTNL